MNITVRFIVDTEPIVPTGNERYPAGTVATFKTAQASWLIDNGYAVDVLADEPQKASVSVLVVPEMPEVSEPDWGAMKIAELRTEADGAGIKTRGVRKAQLVSALSAWWNDTK